MTTIPHAHTTKDADMTGLARYRALVAAKAEQAKAEQEQARKPEPKPGRRPAYDVAGERFDDRYEMYRSQQ